MKTSSEQGRDPVFGAGFFLLFIGLATLAVSQTWLVFAKSVVLLVLSLAIIAVAAM